MSASGVARALNVTTGSFYWHFKSVDAFKDALRRYWQKDLMAQIAQQARARADGDPKRLMEALRSVIIEGGTHRYDVAMRNWASEDKQTAKAVAAADQWRQKTMTSFLMEAGLSEEEARDRISLAGAAWAGSNAIKAEQRMKLLRMATQKD